MDKTEFIKKLINETGLNMKAFAEKAGIPYTTLRSMLERGIENASVNNVIKVCKQLDICVETLYDMCKQDISISSEEKTLLENFNKLNELGKKEANKRVAELTEIKKYQQETDKKIVELPNKKKEIWEESGKEHLMPIASHDRNGEFTEEEYDHDDDLMDNEDFWK